MSQELKPCPFCGGNSAFNEHDDECYFTVLKNVKAAPRGDISGMIDLIPAWNRRHEAQQPAQAAADARDADPVGDWTLSSDEERFHGQFNTREEALVEAAACGYRFIGRVRHPRDFISDELMGSDIRERVSEILGDEVGEVAECFTMTAEQERELGKLVLDWIEAGPGFHCWGVKDIEEIDSVTALATHQQGGSNA